MTTHSPDPTTTPDLSFISQQLFTAILWVDEALKINWINPQVEQLLAISRGRLLGQSVLMLLAPEELITHSTSPSTKANSASNSKLTDRFRQAQQYQQPFTTHDHIIDFSLNTNTPVSIDYSVTPVVYEDKDYFIVEMWGKDRQSRISEEQRQQQQYSVARQMLRSVAHEVKNPLAGIRGAAQLLERQFNKFNSVTAFGDSDFRNSDKQSLSSEHILQKNIQTLTRKLPTYTNIIISETDRLTQLIGQLLGSNQLADWQPLNIHQPLEHVLTLILNQYPDIYLQRDYDLSLPELQADRDQLIQVFLNLINNACESMSEYAQQLSSSSEDLQNPLYHSQHPQTPDKPSYQPKLFIQTRIAFQHTIGDQQHKQVLQISITDNGSGIDASLIGQVFFPMVTSRAEGTGLGLSIVQDIISRHHGMIKVKSIIKNEGDEGIKNDDNQTCFTIYLPFTQPIIHDS